MNDFLKMCLALIVPLSGTLVVLGQWTAGAPVLPANPHHALQPDRLPVRQSCKYDARTFVVFAGGAGENATLSENLQFAYEDLAHNTNCRRPILRPIDWSTPDNNLEDYRNAGIHVVGAAGMVCEIQRIRQASPASSIVLIGYSAGASVVLLATDQLPPCAVERIILLGPAVSSRYDLRRALKAARLGIDVFLLPGDILLEYMEDTYGAPGGRPGSTLAGRSGFLIADPRRGLAGSPLLCGLRQHDMSDSISSHFDMVKPPFLVKHVIPMIVWSDRAPTIWARSPFSRQSPTPRNITPSTTTASPSAAQAGAARAAFTAKVDP